MLSSLLLFISDFHCLAIIVRLGSGFRTLVRLRPGRRSSHSYLLIGDDLILATLDLLADANAFGLLDARNLVTLLDGVLEPLSRQMAH